MDGTWTLQDLVVEAAARLAALPPPKNGQVRAVPDERTIRYYAALGLLDRPAGMRGRTALYAPRHLAQVVAIKRMQSAGKTLAEIQALWPTLDDVSLGRMSGVAVPSRSRPAKREFWKPQPAPVRAQPSLPPRAESHYPVPPRSMVMPEGPRPLEHADRVEVRIELASGAFLTVGIPDGVALSSADIRALRAAAAPLVTELANRGLTAHALGTLEEP